MITSLIILNTFLMACDHYPIEKKLDSALELGNQIISFCFLAEMILKHLGLGFKEYWKDGFNDFDGVLVIVSMVEFFVLQGADVQGLLVLRAFRLLRVFKLAKNWDELRKLINTVINSLASISYLGLLMILFVFIYALVGMQMFGAN